MNVRRFDFTGPGKETPDGYYVLAQDYIDLLGLLRIAEAAIRTQHNPPTWWHEHARKRLSETVSGE